MVNKRLQDLFRLVLEINEENEYQAFLDLCPHVSSISIRIYDEIWEKDKNMVSKDFHCYYDSVDAEEELKKMYYAILDYINKEAE